MYKGFYKTAILTLVLVFNFSFQSFAVEKFMLSEELNQKEREKKIDTLTWYNWDNPKITKHY